MTAAALRSSETQRDALGASYLRGTLIALFAMQVLVGQILPLMYQRPPGLIAAAAARYVGHNVALAASWTVFGILVVSLLNRRLQFYSANVLAAYKLYLSYAMIGTDPWLSAYLVLFAFAGIAVAASAKRMVQ